MAIVRLKRLIGDLENNTSEELSSLDKVATTASYAGTAAVATTASYAGTAAVAATGTSGSAL